MKLAGWALFIISLGIIFMLLLVDGKDFHGPSYVMGFMIGPLALGLNLGIDSGVTYERKESKETEKDGKGDAHAGPFKK